MTTTTLDNKTMRIRSQITSNAAALLLAAIGAAPAIAQDAWRCGNTYSQQPCAGGRALALDDARSADQKAQTDAAAKRDAATAERMEKDRLKLEAREGKGAASALLPLPVSTRSPAESTAKPVPSNRPEKPDDLTVLAPRKPKQTTDKKKKTAAAKARKKTAA